MMKRLEAFAQDQASSTTDPWSLQDTQRLLADYYRRAAAAQYRHFSEADLYYAAISHRRTAAERLPATTTVNIFTPTKDANGWSASGRTVIEIVTDDMPFLVDSVTMALEQAGHHVYRLLHPQMRVRRNLQGELTAMVVAANEAEAPDVIWESWMHVEIGRIDAEAAVELQAGLEAVLADVRRAVGDWRIMHQWLGQTRDELAQNPPDLPTAQVDEALAFMDWLGDNHFTFLGAREYRLETTNGTTVLRGVPETGLGILRGTSARSRELTQEEAALARQREILVLSKANSRATVHRPVQMDYVGIKLFDDAGEVVGERRLLGIFSTAAFNKSITQVPLLRTKAQDVLAAAGASPVSHYGKALMEVMENFPRDELFQASVAELSIITSAVVSIREQRQLRLFLRADTFGRFWSALVFMPRDRYNAKVRQIVAGVLEQLLQAQVLETWDRMGETFTAQARFLLRPLNGELLPDLDVDDIEAAVQEAVRSWDEDFAHAVIVEHGEEHGAHLLQEFAGCFPEAYKEDYSAKIAARDIARFSELRDDTDIAITLYERPESAPNEGRLKIYRVGQPLGLSQVLPMLAAMNIEVLEQWPYQFHGLSQDTYLYDFGLVYPRAVDAATKTLVADTILAVWNRRTENDQFNALVLWAGLTWREAMMIRTYARYLRHGVSGYTEEAIVEALLTNYEVAAQLAHYFAARFDPDSHDEQRCQEIAATIEQSLSEVASLTHDKILRSLLELMQATLRTNFYQDEAPAAARTYLSLKLNPPAIPELPQPRPKYEIFVYSPQVEGVHLRFAAVARGGLRWSDRRDDYRAEVLGLVQAQMVKNAVIVPSGAKGGFYAKQLPPVSERDAWMAEGEAAYRTFIRGMLDVTDNLVDGAVVHPARTIRYDEDDPYLVVAADKGTARFSDTANAISAEYNFWLGDAFASGGSQGYDHKGMGITARGAWRSARRHFREMGIDCQTEEFTAVGIGDMSGDVFGNGMLQSPTMKLVAAFDHRDIFLDPDPDPQTSLAERQRLFDLPRSSWQDYNPALISEGGAVHSRKAKSITLTPQVKAVLGIDAAVTALTPVELIKAILTAPVDLLWNGGIGTYVKATTESHEDVADKTNDPLRVNGAQLRARAVVEGGNLGFTQLGRIEYAQQGRQGQGGRINTDFIDNSAGVDTSDHEVNIKVLLDQLVEDGTLKQADRNNLLAAMTDEVAALVLKNNYQQNLALASALRDAPAALHTHEAWIRELEERGELDRELEGLPDRRQVMARLERGEGLTTPELAMLMSITKIVLANELLETDFAEDPFLRDELYHYFPSKMQEEYRPQMDEHRLRAEIIVTQVVNSVVNNAGITYWHRLSEETGASASDIVRASYVTEKLFNCGPIHQAINALDNQIDAAVQTRMRLRLRRLVERSSRWLLHTQPHPINTGEVAARFATTVQHLFAELPTTLGPAARAWFDNYRDELAGVGVPQELAQQIATARMAHNVVPIAQIALESAVAPLAVSRLHFWVGDELGMPALMSAARRLPARDRWQLLARVGVIKDLQAVHARITQGIVNAGIKAALLTDNETESKANLATIQDEWLTRTHYRRERAVTTMAQAAAAEQADLAQISVALQVLGALAYDA